MKAKKQKRPAVDVSLPAGLLAHHRDIDVRCDERSSLEDMVWAAQVSEGIAEWFLKNAKIARALAMETIIKKDLEEKP